MRIRHLPAFLCLLSACAGPEHVATQSPSPKPSQLEVNHAAWQEIGEELRQKHPGKWVLIASGELQGTWLDFDSAWNVAEELPQQVKHAYLYRAGVDDVECTFHLSPFQNHQPRWNQLGIRVRRPWKLTIAAAMDTWYRDDKKVSWGDAGARVQLSPASTPNREATKGANPYSVRAVASNMFEHDLTLREADVAALNLGRFTAPAPAYYLNKEHPCRKVLVRLSIPELGIEAPAVAFVLPASETEKLALQPPLPAKYGFQALDQ